MPRLKERGNGFADCLRLRELADRQTLTSGDRSDLAAIADHLHALLVSRIDTAYVNCAAQIARLEKQRDRALSDRNAWEQACHDSDQRLGALIKQVGWDVAAPVIQAVDEGLASGSAQDQEDARKYAERLERPDA